MLASAVIRTLVLIDAESSRLIKLEPSGADTPETAECIDAGARFRTGSGLVTLVYVWKRSVQDSNNGRNRMSIIF